MGALRQLLRSRFDDLYIIDLGGDGRDSSDDENVFDILTPVTIAIGVRRAGGGECQVRYARVDGTRAEKYAWLASASLASLEFEKVAGGGLEVLTPVGSEPYHMWPSLTQLFPWTARGIQFSRTWPVSESPDVVRERWQRLVSAPNDAKPSLLKESRDARVDVSYGSFVGSGRLPPLSSFSRGEPDAVREISFRSFDRQWCAADRRVVDMPRPALWKALGDTQIFLTALPAAKGYGVGPLLVAQTSVPDLNAFNNRGGIVLPVLRDPRGAVANLTNGLLALLNASSLGNIDGADLAAYLYGVTATRAFGDSFENAMAQQANELRVPLTKDRLLFNEVAELGRDLLWWHTFGERFGDRELPLSASELTSIAGRPPTFGHDDTVDELVVGGGRVGPVSREVFEFEVSGLKVLQSWLGNRMAAGKGKKSSPLDDIRYEEWTFTDELLKVISILQHTVDVTPNAQDLLRRVVAGEVFLASELPTPTEAERKAPK